MTKQKTEHEDTGQSMKTQHRDAANIPPCTVPVLVLEIFLDL